jgi:hypothetical protein
VIHVDRSRVPAPKVLGSARAQEAKRRDEAFFRDPATAVKARHAFDVSVYTHSDVKHALRALFLDKCAYCEQRLDPYVPAGIDHFRPINTAVNLDGSQSVGYWWLAYEWSNIYLSCQKCSSMKANRFPVDGPRTAPPKQGEVTLERMAEALRSEIALLLDPCGPEELGEELQFRGHGGVEGATRRGEVTVSVFSLNREDLVRRRRESAQQVNSALYRFGRERFKYSEITRPLARTRQEFESFARRIFDPAGEFTQAVLQQFARWVKLVRKQGKNIEFEEHIRAITARYLAEGVSVPWPAAVTEPERQASTGSSVVSHGRRQKEAYFTGARRIERITVENFRAIERLELGFPQPKSAREPWMMLLGENGTGKSSLLQAAGLALMGEERANSLAGEVSLRPAALVRHAKGVDHGTVQVKLSHMLDPVTLTFRSDANAFQVTPPEPQVLSLGYGATRLLPREVGKSDQGGTFIRIANLFDPTAPLNDAERWLADTKKLSRNRFHDVREALKDLLMLEPEAEFQRRGGRVTARIFNEPICLHDLSAGFQSVVAMATDIMISLLAKWKSIEIAEGVVLLDEIEVHLHPTWKIGIVERLRRCFPRVTFLATTHDPLCLKGLDDGEIVVLRRDEEDRISTAQGLPSVEDLRVDQILTSHLFGLRATRGARVQKRIDRYAELLGKSRRTRAEQDEFARLRAELSHTLTSTETLVQKEVEEAIKKTLVRDRLPQPALEGATLQEPAPLEPTLQLELKRKLEALMTKARGRR